MRHLLFILIGASRGLLLAIAYGFFVINNYKKTLFIYCIVQIQWLARLKFLDPPLQNKIDLHDALLGTGIAPSQEAV